MTRRILTLISAAGIAFAASTASAATPVYSVNSVGYVKVSCPAGFIMVSNPLNVVSSGAVNHNLSAIIPTVPNSSFFFKFTAGGFDPNPPAFLNGAWTHEVQLLPGEGGFLYVPSAADVVFSGELRQGTLNTDVASGYSIISSQVPQSTTVTALGFVGQPGDIILKFLPATQQWDVFPFQNGNWTPADPVIAAGESFFMINAGPSRQWTRDFSVSN